MLVNTNRLVHFYQGTTGLKTGTTDAAGHCLCATAERNDLNLCAVVLGCTTSDGRFEAAKSLLDYGFSTYCVYRPEKLEPEPLEVIHGTAAQTDLIAEAPERIIVLREDLQNIAAELPELEGREAPLEEGEEVGRVRLMAGEKEIASYPVCVKTAVEELDFGKCFELLLKAGVSMEKNEGKKEILG